MCLRLAYLGCDAGLLDAAADDSAYLDNDGLVSCQIPLSHGRYTRLKCTG